MKTIMMLWLMISQILIMFGFSLFSVINAIYARDVLGIPKSQWWLIFIPLTITMVVAAIPIGKDNRQDRKKDSTNPWAILF